MKKIASCVFLIFIAYSSYSQLDHHFYFGKKITMNSSIREPGHLSGQSYGEWHFSHDQLINYFKYLSEKSDKIKLIEYGRTYENRPLYLAIVSSEENILNLDKINKNHIDWIYSKNNGLKASDIPAIIWLGHSVHGNEASGGNASMLTAYYLVASQEEEVKDMLTQSVVIIDPCLNPDGFNRHASWVNMHQSKNWIDDQRSIQFTESWPRGRTNHYWFDLNRDWLLVQHVETKARLKYYHQWKPSVLTDHHEMGTNGTFFFQPGVPSRTNPNTPHENYVLTKELGYYHAKALDNIGTLYFSEENFDDFYYGKGSSYPDATGAIGILFEQANVSGQIVNNSHGTLTFADAIRNQYKVAVSTVNGTIANKERIQNYQKKFYADAFGLAKNNPVKGYAFGCKEDPSRIYYFLEMLKSHEIQVHRNKESIKIKNTTYSPNEAYIVPLGQYQTRLIKSMFETETNFKDSIFYDISTWNMPMSFNIDAQKVSNSDKYVGAKVELTDLNEGELIGTKSDIGYIFDWGNYNSPKVLNQLLQEGVMVKVARLPFQLEINGKIYDFGHGSIFIPAAYQEISNDKLYSLVKEIIIKNGINLYSLEDGYRHSGIHFGSSNFVPLNKPKVLMLTGDGINSRQAGEIWHLLDFRLDIPITRLLRDRFSRADLFKYTTLIIPGGNIQFEKYEMERLKAWLNEGGNIIALGNSAEALNKQGLIKLRVRKTEKPDSLERVAYASAREMARSNAINGVILQSQIDITHPICYGYSKSSLPVFKNSSLVFEKNSDPYSCPVYIPENSLLSGYLKTGQKTFIKNSAYILNYSVGRGSIIVFSENPNFRGYWYGTNKLFLNSIFFSEIIRNYR